MAEMDAKTAERRREAAPPAFQTKNRCRSLLS
jgi:hypothetical protein